MEEKKSNYLVYAIIFVVILIVATVAVTYAYFKISTDFDAGLTNASASLECIDLSLSDNNTSIGLSYNYPITDTLAMTSGSITPLEVTVTNNCNNEVKYSLALSTLALTTNSANYIEDSKIRYKIVKNDADHKGIDYLSNMSKIATTSKLYSDLTGENGELATKYADYTLKQIYSIDDLVTLGINSSNTYDVYMWVDYYEGDAAMYESDEAVHNEEYDRTTEGKKFAAAISLSFNTGETNEEPDKSFAIYSETDNSLRFYNNDNYNTLSVGDTYNDLAVTAIYNEMENASYSYDSTTATVSSPWFEYADEITSIYIEEKVSPTSTMSWFNRLRNVSYIDVSNLDTSNVTNIAGMFALTGRNVDSFKIEGLSNWDVSNVTATHYMFEETGYSATEFDIGDLSKWDTSKVTSMTYMFFTAGYNATYTLDLSGWKVPLVTNYTNFNTGATTKITPPVWVN